MTELTLSIPDMSCGHCKATVEGAVTGLDAGAKVDIDLDAKTATVATRATPEQLIAALADVGFPASVGG